MNILMDFTKRLLIFTCWNWTSIIYAIAESCVILLLDWKRIQVKLYVVITSFFVLYCWIITNHLGLKTFTNWWCPPQIIPGAYKKKKKNSVLTVQHSRTSWLWHNWFSDEPHFDLSVLVLSFIKWTSLSLNSDGKYYNMIW